MSSTGRQDQISEDCRECLMNLFLETSTSDLICLVNGDHGDESGHQAVLQHGPVEDGAVRGAAGHGELAYACSMARDQSQASNYL